MAMELSIVLGAGLVGLVVAARLVLTWFKLLENDSLTKASEQTLQDPFSLTPVATPSIISEATKSLSIVVPAYNEALRLPGTLDETMQYLQRRRDRQGPLFTFEVIIVDDGSTDGTSSVAFDAVKQYGIDTVRVLQLPRNRGKGYAVKAGVLISRGQSILFMDADGATRVSDLEKLEAELPKLTQGKAQGSGSSSGKAEGLGLVVGSRAHLERTAIAQRHWYRNLLMHGFHLLVMCVAGGTIHDTQCGFKLFTRRAARLLYMNQRLQRWCFDVELLFLAKALGIPAAEVSVNWTEVPGSKIKVTSIIHMTWEMLAVLIGYRLTGLWTIKSEAVLSNDAGMRSPLWSR